MSEVEEFHEEEFNEEEEYNEEEYPEEEQEEYLGEEENYEEGGEEEEHYEEGGEEEEHYEEEAPFAPAPVPEKKEINTNQNMIPTLERRESEYEDWNPNVICWANSLYDYQAQTEQELDMEANVVVGIIEEGTDGWTYVDINGREGLVPTNYIQKVDEQGNAILNSTPQNKEEIAEKRRQEREQMKEEMRKMKEELQQIQKEKEIVEKQVKDLTNTKNTHIRELRSSKSTKSDRSTFITDVLRLSIAMDRNNDTMRDIQKEPLGEVLTPIINDTVKESKQSPALAGLAKRMPERLRAYQTEFQSSAHILNEISNVGGEFYTALEQFGIILEKNKL